MLRSDQEESPATNVGDSDAPTATRVSNLLREQIISGALPPGTRLKDTSLAERHQVSRNTLRDALRQLEIDGLVVLRRNAGFAVRTLTEDDAHDIYRVRHVLEPAGIEASTHVGRGDLAVFGAIVAASRAAASEGRWAELGTTSLRLHQAIVGLVDSPRTNAFFSNILAQLRLVFAVMEDESAFQAQWLDRDAELVRLLLSGKRRQVQLELRQYLLDSEAQVIDAIRLSTEGERSGPRRQ